MEKCKSCIYYDTEKSNDNWNVCNLPMPLEVIMSGTSENCDGYKQKGNNEN